MALEVHCPYYNQRDQNFGQNNKTSRMVRLFGRRLPLCFHPVVVVLFMFMYSYFLNNRLSRLLVLVLPYPSTQMLATDSLMYFSRLCFALLAFCTQVTFRRHLRLKLYDFIFIQMRLKDTYWKKERRNGAVCVAPL